MDELMTIQQLLEFCGREAPELLPDPALAAQFRASAAHHLTEAVKANTSETTMLHGAVYLLAGYNDGYLLTHPLIREHMTPFPDPLSVQFTNLGWAAPDALNAPGIRQLGRHAFDAVQIACGMGAGIPILDLGHALHGFDQPNRRTAARAFQIALERCKTSNPLTDRAEDHARIQAEWQAWSRIQNGTATEADWALLTAAFEDEGHRSARV